MIFKSKYLEIKRQYYIQEPIYTDGSKDGERVPVAALIDDKLHQFRLPDKSSIFSAELKAIDLVLDHIKEDNHWRYIIFTDSLSAMQALDNALITKLLDKFSDICENDDAVFC